MNLYIHSQKLLSLRSAEETSYVVILSYNYRFKYSSKNYFKLKDIPLQDRKIRGEGNIWHTFHFIVFNIFFVLARKNLTAHVASSNLGLQSDLHNDTIHKE
jgi:hypothetical protein